MEGLHFGDLAASGWAPQSLLYTVLLPEKRAVLAGGLVAFPTQPPV